MRRAGRWLVAIPAALLLTVALVLYTPLGTGLLLGVARLSMPGDMTWEWVSGVPAGPLVVHGLRLDDGRRRIGIDRLRLDWQPRELPAGGFRVHSLQVAGVRIHERAPAPRTSVVVPQPPRLPVAIVLRSVILEDLVWTRAGEGAEFRLERAVLEARLVCGRLEIALLEAMLPEARLRLAGEISQGNRLDVRLDVRGREARMPVDRLEAMLTGSLEHARLQARLQAPALLAAPVRVSGRVGWRGDRLEWQGLEIEAEQADLRLVSHGHWVPDAGTGSLAIEGDPIGWPLAPAARRIGGQGRLTVSGSLDDWRLEASFRLAGPAVPEGDWRLAARGNRTGLQLERFSAGILGGTLEGRGRIDWRPGLHWRIEVSGEDIDPSAWSRAARWPGRLAFEGILDGERLPAGGIEAGLRLGRLDGTLRERRLRGQGAIRLHGQRLAVEGLRLSSGNSTLRVDGHIGPQRLALAWRAEIPALDDFVPDATGRLIGHGQVAGSPEAPRLMGHLQGKDVRLAGLEVERLVADWDAGMRAEAPLRLHIEAGQVAIGSLAWAQVRVDGQGTGGRHEVVLDAEGTSGQVHVALAGGWRGVAAWQGRLRRADWLGSPAGDWRLESPVGVQAGQAVRIDGPLCWHSPPASLCLRIVGRPAGAMVAVGLEGLPARRLAFLWPALEERRLEGAITLEASLKQAATLTGQGRLCLGTGRFLRVRGERPAYEDFEGGCLDLRLDRQGLAIAGELRLDADNGLGLDVRLPGYHPGAPPASQAVRGTLRLAVERLERLAPWVAALDRLEGRAAGALVITGTLGRPALALDVRIEEAVVGIPATGVDWTDVRLELSGSSGGAGIGITGRARSGEGGIAIEGRLRLTSLADWRLELRVSGSDALVAALPEARVVVSPRLRLWLRPRRVRVEGRVTVPEARLKPVKLSQPVRVSPDALVVGAEGDETGAAGWRTAARIEIVLGDDVHFEGGGLRARLGGRLTVIDRGEGVPVANGRLAIREGTFRLQGAPIAIRRGMLLYADTPLEDPGLDILLERETERALVRARIGGTLQAPVLELSSDPPLPQTETLALLLTGREASDAGPAEGRWLLEAARRLGLVGGNLLGQRLGESIGLAEARLSLGESLNEAALALGTWLSPRLYVSWTIGLFDPVAAMRIRYRLGRHLQLEINSGAEGSGGDILYTIEK